MVTTFEPGPGNTRDLRDAFGRFASGVTIVTAPSNDGPVGLTANSFSSLSLDPPLLLWSPFVGSRRFAYFEKATHFAVHVLAMEQEDHCHGFARDPHAFDAADRETNEHNVPLLKNCLARFECQQHAIYPGGDHAIMVGKVLRAEMREGDALAFYAGKFRTLDCS